jgi:hypothetical protein
VCCAVELLVMSTVPPHVTDSELGENAYDVPLSTIDSDADDELFGQATGAVDVGFGVGLALVADGFGVNGRGLVGAGDACVAVALGCGATERRTADGEGAADVGTPLDALAIGLADGPASKAGFPPPPHPASTSVDRASVTGSRRSDISACTHCAHHRFSRR